MKKMSFFFVLMYTHGIDRKMRECGIEFQFNGSGKAIIRRYSRYIISVRRKLKARVDSSTNTTRRRGKREEKKKRSSATTAVSFFLIFSLSFSLLTVEHAYTSREGVCVRVRIFVGCLNKEEDPIERSPYDCSIQLYWSEREKKEMNTNECVCRWMAYVSMYISKTDGFKN